MSLAIDLALSEDGRDAYLAMTDEDGTAVEGMLDAADIDDIIQRLGQLRAAMADAVADRLEPSARVAAIKDPAWWCQPRADDTAVCFRHPGFGWLAFGLPHHEAKKLAEWLVKEPPKEA
jgi:hypothetical protein